MSRMSGTWSSGGPLLPFAASPGCLLADSAVRLRSVLGKGELALMHDGAPLFPGIFANRPRS